MLASKVYYFLGEYDEALSFALGAGSAFDAETTSSDSAEYVETIVCESHLSFDLAFIIFISFAAKAIDHYIEVRVEESEGSIDPRLSSIIEGIFRRCIDDGEYKQVGLRVDALA